MSRRLARETALQVLYQLDLSGGKEEITNIINNWGIEFSVPEKSLQFTTELVSGTLEKTQEIDQRIADLAHEWALDRMSAVDRNLMRLAIFEMLYDGRTPQRVIVNEAIEIAKRFGGDDSAKFINGILDKLIDASEK